MKVKGSMQYKTCPHCGANLDPGERCDCEKIADSQPDEKETAA